MGRSGLGLHPGSTGPQARRCSQVMGHPCGEGRSRRRTGRCHEEDGDGVCVGAESCGPDNMLRASASDRPSADTVTHASSGTVGSFRPRGAVLSTFGWRGPQGGPRKYEIFEVEPRRNVPPPQTNKTSKIIEVPTYCHSRTAFTNPHSWKRTTERVDRHLLRAAPSPLRHGDSSR